VTIARGRNRIASIESSVSHAQSPGVTSSSVNSRSTAGAAAARVKTSPKPPNSPNLTNSLL
jgi:hypothetical protein